MTIAKVTLIQNINDIEKNEHLSPFLGEMKILDTGNFPIPSKPIYFKVENRQPLYSVIPKFVYFYYFYIAKETGQISCKISHYTEKNEAGEYIEISSQYLRKTVIQRLVNDIRNDENVYLTVSTFSNDIDYWKHVSHIVFSFDSEFWKLYPKAPGPNPFPAVIFTGKSKPGHGTNKTPAFFDGDYWLPSDATDPASAVHFVNYMVGGHGRRLGHKPDGTTQPEFEAFDFNIFLEAELVGRGGGAGPKVVVIIDPGSGNQGPPELP